MTTTKTKTKKAEEPTVDAVANLNEVIDLSRAFTKEIENIMTVDGLTYSQRSSALGTATKHFAEAVEQVAAKNV